MIDEDIPTATADMEIGVHACPAIYIVIPALSVPKMQANRQGLVRVSRTSASLCSNVHKYHLQLE